MNKEFLLTVLIILTVALSVSTIYASEVNITDQYTSYSDCTYMAVENSNVDNDSSYDNILNSDNSDTLSTNLGSNSLLENDDNADVLGSSVENNLSASQISPSKSITSSGLTKYYKGSEKYTATFYDNNGNLLKNTDVQFTVNQKTYTVKTNANGIGSLAIGLLPGNHKITAYNPVTQYSLTKTITVLPTITAKNLTKYYKGSAKYSAKFLDTEGNLLKNTNVQLTINSKTYTAKTNANGIASLAIGLLPGTYQITAKNPINSEALTTTIKILRTINATSITKVYTDNKLFYARFLTGEGKAVANQKVKFTINGQTYTKTTTSAGLASLSLTNLPVGTYTMVLTNVDGLTVSKNVKVIASTSSKLVTKSYTFLTGDTKTINVRLLNGLGYAPDSGKAITFNVNGKSYTAKTNANGYAKLTLPSLSAGTYSVKYSFAGNSIYTASSATDKIYVIPSKTPTFTVKSGTTFVRGETGYFKVALTSGSVPLEGKQVTFKVNGKSYTKTTNSKGIATLPIGLNVGKYTVSYTNKAESKINSVTGSSTIAEKYPTTLTWKSSATFDSGTNTFSVLLSNSKGAISNASVKLVANSKTYTAKTGSNGIAKFNVNLPDSGKYTIKYSFGGNTQNVASSGNKTITIQEKTVTLKSILDASSTIKSYYASNKELPDTVTADGVKFTMPEFLYLMSQAIQQLGDSDKSAIAYITGVSKPTSPSGDSINTNLYTSDYLTVAKNVADYIKSYKKAPNYIPSPIGKLSYPVLTEAFSRVMAYYGTNKQLPNYVSINSEAVSSDEISIASIITTAKRLKAYYATNKKLPNSVTTGGIKVTMAEFLYLMSQATYQLGNSDKSSIKYISGISTASSPSGDTINGKLKKADYLTVANNVANFIKSNKQAPNYASSTLGKLSYPIISDAFARILTYYGENKQLPGSATIKSSSNPSPDSTPSSKEISISSIIITAKRLKAYYATNKKLPNSVTTGGIKVTMAEFLYLMSQATYQLGNSDKSSIKYISGISTASSPSGDTINGKLKKADYLTVANNVANFIKSNKQAPNYASSTLGKLSYPIVSDAFARILTYYGEHKQLPGSASIKSSSNPSPQPSPSQQGSGLNEKNTITNLEPYLSSSTNCPVDAASIKSVVNSLTSGLTSVEDKAVALYNYVRDSISYTFYYDTRYGAVGTLNAKTGNCVDQAHLLIAMYRTAGIPARYVHGASCTFTSGTYGHVWAQVLIGDTWIVSDPTSSRNSFGKIVNWNTNTFSLRGIYSGISF